MEIGQSIMTPNGLAVAVSLIYIDRSRAARGEEPDSLYVRHPKGAHIDASRASQLLGNGKGLGQAAIYRITDCQLANGLPGMGA